VFEGFELVEKSIEMAMLLKAKINDHPRLRKYFSILTIKDLIPDEYRQSGQEEYYNDKTGWKRLEHAWEQDEFVLDPTKLNLYIGKTGVDGDTFKNKFLMDKFSIQINKTSRNTVLLMTNIGTTRSSVSYLISSLLKITHELDSITESLNKQEAEILNKKIHSLTYDTPPLPDFSYYHDFFRPLPGIPGGNIRKAYYLAYKEINCDYIRLVDCEDIIKNGRDIISASFVIPYPPGFPVLVPGQVMTKEILNFLLALDVKEIHGYRPELGLRVFREEALMDKKPLVFENKKIKIETENKSNGKHYTKLKTAVLGN
jgi:arginine decarboxylase